MLCVACPTPLRYCDCVASDPLSLCSQSAASFLLATTCRCRQCVTQSLPLGGYVPWHPHVDVVELCGLLVGFGSCQRAVRDAHDGGAVLCPQSWLWAVTGLRHESRVREEQRKPHGGGQQGCIGREGTSEAASEAVRQAVGGDCRSGWGRLLSVTRATEAGTWGTVGAVEGGGGGGLPPFQCITGRQPWVSLLSTPPRGRSGGLRGCKWGQGMARPQAGGLMQ